MDIIFKGRRTDVPERFRIYASAKLGKVEKLDHRAMRVDVEVSQERNPRLSDRRERVELTIRSRGPVIRAEAAADDRYVALDLALAKLETRLRRSGERRKARRVHAPDRNGAARAAEAAAGAFRPGGQGGAPTADGALAADVAAAARESEPQPEASAGLASDRRESVGDGSLVPIQMEGDGPVVVREKYHAAAPMSVDQALLEMELVGHDFYLFRDENCGHPSVVYRRHGYQYGLIRLVEDGSGNAGASGEGMRSAVGGHG